MPQDELKGQMSIKENVRAHTTAQAAGQGKLNLQIALPQVDLQRIAQLMFSLMLRNVATDGFLFVDPTNTGTYSLPGCVVAAPSFPANTPGIDQNYVYNWMRDAAITAMEITVANIPGLPGGGVQQLNEYVNFAQVCQANAKPTLGHACYTINGYSRSWTEQNDGPALQTLAMLQMYAQLDAPTQAIAKTVMTTNINYLMGAYQDHTTNLWEEHSGYSFFARSAQLLCLQAIKANTIGIAVPAGTDAAIAWLQTALQQHWNGTFYVSMLDPQPAGYDPNIDIVCACIYGAVAVTDTKLLATAAQLRDQWAAPGHSQYPINVADGARGIGPLLGRYPGDTYDGDMADHIDGEHPWALCTCNFAQLYYKLSNDIAKTKTVPYDDLSALFFNQIGVQQATPAADVVTALQNAGDAMLGAVIFHSDHLELSEQFDGDTGFEKSVKNLTWSYAAFLSAVREKTGQPVRG